jgi:hypothetical protein
MTCPQAPDPSGPFKVHEYVEWQVDRWEPRPDKDGKDWIVWPEGFPKPRTCGYCGCVHPDDLAQLIAAGWELEHTTKGYKYYVHPPGYRESRGEWVNNGFTGMPLPSPVPPVKLYTYHVNDLQAVAINTALAEWKNTRDAGTR